MKASGARKNSRSDTSLNLIGSGSGGSRRRSSKEYGHVKSKVREYIDEVKRLSSSASSRKKSENSNCNSFQLSPGRKSLSMSNLAAEEEGMGAHHRQPSSREYWRIARMRSQSLHHQTFLHTVLRDLSGH